MIWMGHCPQDIWSTTTGKLNDMDGMLSTRYLVNGNRETEWYGWDLVYKISRWWQWWWQWGNWKDTWLIVWPLIGIIYLSNWNSHVAAIHRTVDRKSAQLRICIILALLLITTWWQSDIFENRQVQQIFNMAPKPGHVSSPWCEQVHY